MIRLARNLCAALALFPVLAWAGTVDLNTADAETLARELKGIGAARAEAIIAWREENVPQCGYCQAGQIMSAAALLASKPRPSDTEIESAMRGNLCRCGTYVRIRTAIKRAADGGNAA